MAGNETKKYTLDTLAAEAGITPADAKTALGEGVDTQGEFAASVEEIRNLRKNMEAVQGDVAQRLKLFTDFVRGKREAQQAAGAGAAAVRHTLEAAGVGSTVVAGAERLTHGIIANHAWAQTPGETAPTAPTAAENTEATRLSALAAVEQGAEHKMKQAGVWAAVGVMASHAGNVISDKMSGIMDTVMEPIKEGISKFTSILSAIGEILLGPLMKIFWSIFGAAPALADELPADLKPQPKPAPAAPEKPAVAPSEERRAQFKTDFVSYVERVLRRGEPMPPDMRERVSTLAGEYSQKMNEIGKDAADGNIYIMKTLGLVFAVPIDAVSFMLDLVLTGAVSVSDLCVNVAEGTLNHVSIGFAGIESLLGTEGSESMIGEFSIENLGSALTGLDEKQKAILFAVMYSKVGLVSRLFGAVSSMALSVGTSMWTSFEGQALTNRGFSGASFANFESLAKNFSTISQTLSGSQTPPEFIKDLTKLVQDLEAKMLVREAYFSTLGTSLDDQALAAFRQRVQGIALPAEKGSFLAVVRERMATMSATDAGATLATIGAENANHQRAIAKSFLDSVDSHFRGVSASMPLKTFEQNPDIRRALSEMTGHGGGRAAASMLSTELLAYHKSVDESFRLSGNGAKALSEIRKMMRTGTFGRSYRQVYATLPAENSEAFTRHMTTLAKESPDIARSLWRSFGILSIAGLSGLGAEWAKDYVANFARGLGCLFPFGTLAVTWMDLKDAKFNFDTMSVEGGVELALVGGITAYDAGRVGLAAFRSVTVPSGHLATFLRPWTAPVADIAATAQTMTRLTSAGYRVGANLAGSIAEWRLLNGARASGLSASNMLSVVRSAEGGAAQAVGRLALALREGLVTVELARAVPAAAVLLAIGLAVSAPEIAQAYEQGKTNQELVDKLRAAGFMKPESDEWDMAKLREGIMALLGPNREAAYRMLVESALYPSEVLGVDSTKRMEKILVKRDYDVAGSGYDRTVDLPNGRDYVVKSSGDKVVVEFRTPVYGEELDAIKLAFGQLGTPVEVVVWPEAYKPFIDLQVAEAKKVGGVEAKNRAMDNVRAYTLAFQAAPGVVDALVREVETALN